MAYRKFIAIANISSPLMSDNVCTFGGKEMKSFKEVINSWSDYYINFIS